MNHSANAFPAAPADVRASELGYATPDMGESDDAMDE